MIAVTNDVTSACTTTDTTDTTSDLDAILIIKLEDCSR